MVIFLIFCLVTIACAENTDYNYQLDDVTDSTSVLASIVNGRFIRDDTKAHRTYSASRGSGKSVSGNFGSNIVGSGDNKKSYLPIGIGNTGGSDESERKHVRLNSGNTGKHNEKSYVGINGGNAGGSEENERKHVPLSSGNTGKHNEKSYVGINGGNAGGSEENESKLERNEHNENSYLPISTANTGNSEQTENKHMRLSFGNAGEHNENSYVRITGNTGGSELNENKNIPFSGGNTADSGHNKNIYVPARGGNTVDSGRNKNIYFSISGGNTVDREQNEKIYFRISGTNTGGTQHKIIGGNVDVGNDNPVDQSTTIDAVHTNGINARITSIDHNGMRATFSHSSPAELDKEFYTFSAPDEAFNDANALQHAIAKVKQGIRVLFIKGPQNKELEEAAISLARQAAQQQTAIYVLNKQANIGDLATTLNNINNNNGHKPDVHFVKYRTSEDAVNAQKTIQAKYEELSGSSQSINGGIAPVLNFASASTSSSKYSQLSPRAYLPTSALLHDV